MFPVIDGHFWVERNGEIIDPDFEYYDTIKRVNKCKGKAIHLPASSIVQQVVIKAFKKGEDFYGVKDSDYLGRRPQVNCCYQNARQEIIERGGTLIFGSMGWRNKTGIHYEFGGDGWTVSQFLK